MSGDDTAKVTPARLRRDAYLYIRQSTLYQVINNTESAGRQYDLKHRAVALGWPEDKIHVIDIDQGHSGASAADRAGFQHLVAEVSLGRAGIVLGLECSRLARDSADWQQLVKICAHTDTLILDEDGLYDPAIFNDRVLLGMKGQIPEFELHFLRARMRGGILAKARRGELALALPIGLVHDHHGQVVPDPDAGIRHADGANRLVADALEADWNTALRALAAARDDYRKATAAATVPGQQQRDKIRALAVNLPGLWNDPGTPMRERKRLIRLLITDVTLTRGQDTITAAIRFPAGRHHVLRLPAPKNAWQLRATPAQLTELIEHLLDSHTYAQIAGQLNAAGHTSSDGHPRDGDRVAKLVNYHQMPSHDQRLCDRGLLSLEQIANHLGAHPSSIKRWHRLGLITGEQADDRGIFRYHPGQTRPAPADTENARKRLGDDHRSGRRNPHRTSGRPRTPRQNVRPPGNTETTSTTAT